MPTNSTNNPHDEFFRKSLAQPEILRESVQRWLPATIVEQINLDTLQIEPGRFTDDILASHQSDLLVSAQLANEDPIFLFFLIEHKASPDPWVGLQTLRYMVRVWETQRAEKEQLVPILPIVFYHGERPWRVPTEFHALFEKLPVDAQLYVPNFHFVLQDFSWRNPINLNQIAGR